jgi:hypothetical protein
VIQTYLRLVGICATAALALPALAVAVGAGAANQPVESWVPAAWLVAFSVVSIPLARRTLRRHAGLLTEVAEAQVEWLDRLSPRGTDAVVFGAAGLGLLIELVIIRWQGTVLELFAFYKNFGLLACFAGLGLGYALADRKRIPLVLTAPLLALQVLVLMLTRHGLPDPLLATFRTIPVLEETPMGSQAAVNSVQMGGIYLVLTVSFLLTALALLPVGQLAGAAMDRSARLRGYGLNLLGSLAGVLAAMALSWLWTPPTIWFALAGAGVVLFQTFDRRQLTVSALAVLVCASVLAWPVDTGWERIYSPYQLLELGPSRLGQSQLRAAGHYFQRMLDLDPEAGRRRSDPDLQRAGLYYELPYELVGSPETVAVLGAGTGNDVATALRQGAQRVVAVELDPGIARIGQAYHPEAPYSDPRVELVVDDARSYLRRTEERFDLIAFGLLDSHTLLSHGSSVRVDSFVYTMESFREARARLREGGAISLSFSVASKDIGGKIHRMLTEAFDGQTPICKRGFYDDSLVFLQVEGSLQHPDAEDLRAHCQKKYGGRDVDVSTDDWPFFYMPKRVYPLSYVAVLSLLLLLSALLTRSFFSGRPRLGALPFFFLGAGFMLVETKGITELGLVFGNTWQVVGIVIAGILVMAFLANLYVDRFGFDRPGTAFALLLATLALGIYLSRGGGFPPTAAGKLSALVVLTSPLFFSGLVFSTLLRTASSGSGALAANIFGSLCGGLLEYNSMYFGFGFLYWIAAALYAGAFLTAWLHRRRETRGAAPS